MYGEVIDLPAMQAGNKVFWIINPRANAKGALYETSID